MTTTEQPQSENEIFLIVRGQYDDAEIMCSVLTETEALYWVETLNKVGGASGPVFSFVKIPLGIGNIPHSGEGVKIGYAS